MSGPHQAPHMRRGGYRQRVEDNTAHLAELGQWGVPTFVFRGEAYWGQDRIEDLETALTAAGLARDSVHLETA